MIALKVRTRQSQHRRRRGRAHARLPRRRASWRSHAPTYQTRGLHPAGPRLRRGRRASRCAWRRWSRSTPRATTRHQRAAGRRAVKARAALSRLRRGARRARAAPGTSCGRSATSSCRSEPRVQLLLRFHIAHVLQVCSRHTAHHDAGVPARGPQRRGLPRARLLGRAVRLPVPQLPAARDHPRAAAVPLPAARRGPGGGARGGLPRRDVSRGRAAATAQEETQVVHLNPLSGQWDPDLSHNQRHVNAAIFYNVWHYYQATDDLEFLRDYGAEMMLEIARFWASIAHYNPERDRYEIHGVMGPDEFHETLPRRRPRAGCATTPTPTSWWPGSPRPRRGCSTCCRRAAATRCGPRIGLTDDEIAHLGGDEPPDVRPVPRATGSSASSRATRTSRSSTGTAYRAKHGNIQRLDRILQGRGRRPRPLQGRQAGRHGHAVLPVPRRRAAAALRPARLRLSPRTIARRTIDYYDQRTSHGSTLSLIVHAGVLAGIDPESSWERFLRRRWRATSATSRAARPRRASTWG